ncbi:MAG: hypothetical protein ACE5R4_19045, partial [Armatimonadota bacterium]
IAAMIARTLLALLVCPFLGAVTGRWVMEKADGWLRAGGLGVPLHVDPAYGALGGLGVGAVFAGVMIWCFGRGRRSPQRALADLVIIPLASLGLLNAFYLTESTSAVAAVAWLLGLLLCLIAFGRHLVREDEEVAEDEPSALPLLPEDEYY